VAHRSVMQLTRHAQAVLLPGRGDDVALHVRALDAVVEGRLVRLVQRPDRHERSEEHTSELQSRFDLVCRLLLEKKKMKPLSCEVPRAPSSSAQRGPRGSPRCNPPALSRSRGATTCLLAAASWSPGVCSLVQRQM